MFRKTACESPCLTGIEGEEDSIGGDMDLKQLARQYFGAVNRYDVETVTKMVHPDYIQHNPFVPTGRDAFVSLLPKLASHNSKIINLRMLQDDDHVIMHHRWENAEPLGGEELAAFHIIRFDSDRRIAEHWNVSEPLQTRQDGERPQVDGPSDIYASDHTQEHKTKINALFAELIASSELTRELLKEFFHEDHVLHKINISAGLDGLLKQWQKQDMKIQHLHRVFAEGNWVLAIAEGMEEGVSSAFYQLFRLNKNKIVESWGVTQSIPTTGLANDNTMFGFS